MRGYRQCDVIVASIHWGGSWGYRIRDEETCFAHQLIEHGIAVVHGHSSHHVKTAEIYSDRLALYGCGDFLNDYEGINGYESDLTLMYLPAIDPRLGQLVEALLVPMRVARFRLNRAVEADAEWLCLRSTYCDLSAQAFKRQPAWSRRVRTIPSRADYIYESINAGTQAMERSKTCGCSIISKQHLQLLNDFTAFLLGAFAE